ncbi:hypothetical protein GGX14DRAFT_424612 [Mycena pura]|uniref:Uncharacterized protein n=1 Tax=Mycena pura TaxID=153505 RepID=A0AAD7E1W3_9AGAR|nr:hypothetical protein GGX14DRAFT_424612 [Mycena pura]
MWTTRGQRLRGYLDGSGRSQTLTRPHYTLDSTGNISPGQLRLSACWTFNIQPGSEGRISDDMPLDIHIIPQALDSEQDFRVIIAYYITHRPNLDLPIDDSFILLHQVKYRFLTYEKPTELASLVQRINLDGRQIDNDDITHTGLRKLNLPVRPRNFLRKLLQKIRQRAKISSILSEQTPLITVCANGRVDTCPFSYETLKNRLLIESKIIS